MSDNIGTMSNTDLTYRWENLNKLAMPTKIAVTNSEKKEQPMRAFRQTDIDDRWPNSSTLRINQRLSPITKRNSTHSMNTHIEMESKDKYGT